MTRDKHLAWAVSVGVLVWLVCLWFAPLAVAQRTPVSADEFSAASPESKRALLNGLATHKITLEPSELTSVLAQGIRDPDADVRATALWALAGRAGSVRFTQTDDRIQQWHREQPALLAVKPTALAGLQDTDANARLAAIVALANLEYRVGDPPVGLRLSEELLQTFAALFRSELSPLVRAEIANTFAWCSTQSDTRSQLLLNALNDDSAGVVSLAVQGVGKLRLTTGLPRVLDLLSHKDKSVRVVVAQAVAEYGSAALPFLAELRAAAASEPDQITKKTLEGAVAVLERRIQ